MFGETAQSAKLAPPTVRKYLDSWIAKKHAEIAPKTERTYRLAIENFNEYVGHLRLDRLGANHISRALGAIEQPVVADAAASAARARRRARARRKSDRLAA